MEAQSTPVLSRSGSSRSPSFESDSSKSRPWGTLSTKSLSSDRTLGLDHNSGNSRPSKEFHSLEQQLLPKYPNVALLDADTQHSQSARASIYPPPAHDTGCSSSKEIQKRQTTSHKGQVDEESGEQFANTERKKGRALTVQWLITIIAILGIAGLAITVGLVTKDVAVGLSSAGTGFELVTCVVALLHALG